MNGYKIGDRVKVYDICQKTFIATEDKGTILSIDGYRTLVKTDCWGTPPFNSFWFHAKQCRKLVKKKKKVKLNDVQNALEIMRMIREFNTPRIVKVQKK